MLLLKVLLVVKPDFNKELIIGLVWFILTALFVEASLNCVLKEEGVK